MDKTAMHDEEHFGPAGHPVWAQHNPVDLVRAGGFDGHPPELLIDVTVDDTLTKGHNLRFAAALENARVPHTFKVHSDKETLKHNWDTWEQLLPTCRLRKATEADR